MGNSAAVLQIFKATNIKVLRDQSIQRDGIQIVGIDDKSYRGTANLADILQKSKISNEGKFTLMMSHQPQKLAKLDGYPIDLELA